MVNYNLLLNIFNNHKTCYNSILKQKEANLFYTIFVHICIHICSSFKNLFGRIFLYSFRFPFL